MSVYVPHCSCMNVKYSEEMEVMQHWCNSLVSSSNFLPCISSFQEMSLPFTALVLTGTDSTTSVPKNDNVQMKFLDETPKRTTNSTKTLGSVSCFAAADSGASSDELELPVIETPWAPRAKRIRHSQKLEPIRFRLNELLGEPAVSSLMRGHSEEGPQSEATKSSSHEPKIY